MTNAEYYEDQINEFRNNTKDFCEEFIAPIILNVSNCRDMNCSVCSTLISLWLAKEYKEPEPDPKIDWDSVAVDTPIVVGLHKGGETYLRHFADYKDGKVYAWNDGQTSITCENNSSLTTEWPYASIYALGGNQ